MKVKDLIKALEKMPEDADVYLANAVGEYDYGHILGLSYDSEYDDFGYCSYMCVAICCMSTVSRYEEIIDEDFKLYGDSVWYNTMDTIEVYDENNKEHLLRFDEESEQFKDVGDSE